MRSVSAAWVFLVAGAIAVIAWSSNRSASIIRENHPSSLANYDRIMNQVGSIGYGSFLASLYWIQEISAYADQVLGGVSRENRVARLHLIQVLDPKWENPYQFALLTLEDARGKPSDSAIAMGRRGINEFPGSWRLRLYLALALQDRGDTLGASEVLEPLIIPSREPVPAFVRELAITLVSRTEGSSSAVERILFTLRTVSDPVVRLSMQSKLTSILADAGVPCASILSEMASQAIVPGSDQDESIRSLLMGAVVLEPVSLQAIGKLASSCPQVEVAK